MTNPLDPNASYTQIIDNYLDQWGLSDLKSIVDSLGRSGASSDQISLTIQNSDEYKKRFAGNAQRVANGLAALDPASYIALEGQYKQILSQLPAGFYDDKASIDNFIGGDVSPSELSDRVSLANQAWVNAPQSARDAWNQYYGHSGTGGAVAAILDTSVAEPLIQQQVTAAGIGGAAVDQGLSLTSQATAMKAAQQGVTIQSARQAYSQIAQRLGTDQSISGRFSNSSTGTLDQGAEEQATLLGDAGAIQKQNLLYSEEKSQFMGKGGGNAAAGDTGSNY